MSALKQRYITLLDELRVANESYYYARPVMTDYEYDTKYIKLQELEKRYPEIISVDSPTQRPGVSPKVQKTFTTAKHSHPMLSLKTETDYSATGAHLFHSRILEQLDTDEAIEYCAELKFDGLGVSLRYENGNLVQALTRGDGEYGEDITENVKMIRCIPKILLTPTGDIPTGALVVRGEIYMGKESFANLNREQASKGEKLYSNPRNAAAGSVRVLDPSVTFSRNLSFYAYTLVQSDKVFTTHYESLMYLQSLCFPVCEYTELYRGVEGLVYFHDKVAVLRESLDVEIDGVVYKVNDLELQDKLGYISREPKWAVAHKYPAQEKQTKLLAIDIQVGRTGKLTPVARLEPIFVGGVTVTSVTLHNEDETIRKDIRVGDIVIVRRAGDVIPEISESLPTTEKRGPEFSMPKICPVCGSPTVKEVEEADYRCTGGMKCSAQVKGGIMHFIQRSAMNIKGLGESMIDQLLLLGLIKNPVDLYKLLEHREQSIQILSRIEGMGNKSATKILDAIEQSKETTLEKFLFALGIRYAGQGTAKRLVEHFKILEGITSATLVDILSVRDIGPTVGNSVYTYFQDKSNLSVIKSLQTLGVHWQKKEVLHDNYFSGKNIVITGTLFSMTRDMLKTRLEALGAIISDSVGKRTDLVIAGPKAGSKLMHATTLNIPIIDETTLLEKLK